MNRLYMTCYLDNATGYGQQNCQLVSGLVEAGIDVTLFPTGLVTSLTPIPKQVTDVIVQTPQRRPAFVVEHPGHNAEYLLPHVRFMVWESTKLDPQWIPRINKSTAVITASKWNRDTFMECGITCPIYVIPLFVALPVDQAVVPHEKFVFGCAGNLPGQWERKNLDLVIQAFNLAFPQACDVELQIKCWDPGATYLADPVDPRIKIIRGFMTESELRCWNAGLDVFVHPSKAEGWGFQPLQAMAAGKPVIAARYGGLAEYFNNEVGWELTYSEEEARGMYLGLGEWCNPSLDSLVETMLYVYSNRNEVTVKGTEAAKRAAKLTPTNTVRQLLPLLQKHDILISGS